VTTGAANNSLGIPDFSLFVAWKTHSADRNDRETQEAETRICICLRLQVVCKWSHGIQVIKSGSGAHVYHDSIHYTRNMHLLIIDLIFLGQWLETALPAGMTREMIYFILCPSIDMLQLISRAHAHPPIPIPRSIPQSPGPHRSAAIHVFIFSQVVHGLRSMPAPVSCSNSCSNRSCNMCPSRRYTHLPSI
jgi:hypothetical protein